MASNDEILEILKGMQNSILGLKDDVNSLKDDVKSIKTQQQEDHLILKALEHSAEVNKAEHDKMSNDLAHIHGDINHINETNKSLLEMYGEHEAEIRSFRRRPV